MFKERYLHRFITQDLKNKMVFVGGPRQVGKTTLARLIGKKDFVNFGYLNWDSRSDRKNILDENFEAGNRLLIFDELHKYKRWKGYIKGLYDSHKERFSIMVTGSARLDIYRKGGDSLMGRYHYYRLHPFSVAELLESREHPEPGKDLVFQKTNRRAQAGLEALFKFGGFPEPLVKADQTTWRRFQNERVDRLVKEDVRDLESIRDLSALQVLAEILPTKVGSRFSLNSLREDLDVAHKTVTLWVDVLERLYYHYRIYPFASSKIKALRKEPKIYLWDWSGVENSSARFENLVASHLLKLIHFLHDTQGFKVELYYLGDTAGREVDFLVTNAGRPWFAVEVKESDQAPSKNLLYFASQLKIQQLFQVVKISGVDRFKSGVRVISADKFLSALI